jgi:hypothetical protein
MASQTRGTGAKASRPRKREAGHVFNGDEGGVHLKRDMRVTLDDVLPDPPSDFVMLEDHDWIEDDK